MQPHFTTIPATSGIYRITCTVTGKFYIGSAVNLHVRWIGHLNELRRQVHRNSKLQRAFSKYGEESFIFDVLEYVLLPEMLTAREQYWFNKLKPFGRRGFNIDRVAGSRLGWKPSATTREKLRIAQLGKPGYWTGKKRDPETCEKVGKSHAGKYVSPETGKRISIALTGRVHSPKTREKIRLTLLGHPVSEDARAKMRATDRRSFRKTLIVTSPDGTEYIVHGIDEFCKEHHLHHGHLIEVAKGSRRQHKGYRARFPDTLQL